MSHIACSSAKTKKLEAELKKSKLTIEKLKKEIKSHGDTCQKKLATKMADAFLMGFEEAMIEIEKKADAFDQFMSKSANSFEKEYYKKPSKKVARKKISKKKK